MKRITPFFIVVLVMFLVAACASVTPAPTQDPVQPVATEAPTQPGATEAVPVTGGTQVDITLADNTIETNMTSFQVGVPYTFVITNTGQSTTVEFTFPDTAVGQLLEFSCLIRRHYDDGMKVDITVIQ